MTCNNCPAVIDPKVELTPQHQSLLDAIDGGQLETLTDLQEAIYHNAYCPECAGKFLLDTDS